MIRLDYPNGARAPQEAESANKPGVSRLTHLEAVIEQGLFKVKAGYIEIGAALCKIKEKKLYREQGFHTFDQYCQKRWKFDRVYAWRLIRAAEHVKTLPVGNIPASERQARALIAESKNRSAPHFTDEDHVPEFPETPISQTGDLWGLRGLSDNKLLVGNATNRDHLVRLMGGDGADLIVTDPPYGVDYRGGHNQQDQSRRRIANDNLSDDAYEQFLSDTCRNLLDVSRGAIYIFMSSSEIDTLKRVFVEAGGHWSTFVIWAKHHFTLGWSDYQRQYELILYGWREGGERYWCGERNQGDVWQVNKPVANDLHPTQKPVELVKRAVLNSSRAGEIVLDPFGGSGTTLIASEKTGRRARLMEIDPRYVDVAIMRWQNYTGKQAVLDGDGRTFDELQRTPRAESDVDQVNLVPGH